jgi:hypothetical protein
MQNYMIRSALALMTSGALLLGSAQAQTAAPGEPPVKTKVKKKKAGKPLVARGAKAKFLPGSQETASERSRRLLRECKGRVNAGACQGYTG